MYPCSQLLSANQGHQEGWGGKGVCILKIHLRNWGSPLACNGNGQWLGVLNVCKHIRGWKLQWRKLKRSRGTGYAGVGRETRVGLADKMTSPGES